MFETLIVQPIFNLLVLIYALIPGHNFGLAIILFTILVRLLMWPLVKKQLNHAKALRELQPELKKIKAASKGDRQQESRLTMELYKEKEINPFASLGIVLVQLPILIGLYIGLRKIIDHPEDIISFSYPALHNLSWMKELEKNIHLFDNTLFGIVDLTRKSVGPLYWPALLIAVSSGIMQYLQSKQLMPQSKDSRSLRQILRDSSSGKSADQQEVNAAVGRGTVYFIPAMVTLFAVGLPAALPLYWLTSSSVAFWQQSIILKEDADEADKSVNSTVTKTEITSESKTKSKKSSSAKKKTAKRRKKK
jgi:YidC/Oxa1 family membrane protein insertase